MKHEEEGLQQVYETLRTGRKAEDRKVSRTCRKRSTSATKMVVKES